MTWRRPKHDSEAASSRSPATSPRPLLPGPRPATAKTVDLARLRSSVVTRCALPCSIALPHLPCCIMPHSCCSAALALLPAPRSDTRPHSSLTAAHPACFNSPM